MLYYPRSLKTERVTLRRAESQCLATGKDCFVGEREASRAIDERGWTGDSYTYYCEECDGWHIAQYKAFQPTMPRLRAAVMLGQTRCKQKLSSYRSIHCCTIDGKLYTFVYNKRNKYVQILEAERVYG